MKTRTVTCPICSKQFTGAIANTEWKCPSCGRRFTDIDELSTRMRHDNTLNELEDEYTNKCTKEEKRISTARPEIAFKLCLFFGLFGAHRFYTKKYISGVIYLLTFGLFSFGWIVDTIRMLIGNFKDASGAYVEQPEFAKFIKPSYRKSKMSKKLTSIKSSQAASTISEAYRIVKEKREKK